MVKILLVDDEQRILMSTTMLLRHMGFDVVTATAATEILPTLRRERPDLLLQDVRMPGLEIRALVAEIRADPDIGRTPVLLFSASISLEPLYEEVGAEAMLEKPFRPSDLQAAVERALAPRMHA